MRVRQRKRRGAGQGRKDGTHYVVSDRSGFVYRNTDVVRQWDGLLVGKDEEEPRHPQEFVRGVVDDYAVRNPRPRAPYDFVIGRVGISDRFNQQICSRSSVPIQQRPRRSFAVPLLLDRLDRPIVDRSGTSVWWRSADNIVIDFFGAPGEIAFIDLGSVKSVSNAIIKIDSIDRPQKFLQIYTSTDDVTYTPLELQANYALQDIKLGTPTGVSIGKKARFVSIGYAPPEGSAEVNACVSQFDVYGCD
jgi:hypothetical protein